MDLVIRSFRQDDEPAVVQLWRKGLMVDRRRIQFLTLPAARCRLLIVQTFFSGIPST